MIFRYNGGKSKKSVREVILSYAPDLYKEYREIFCGGAGIFFGIDINIKRWINDIDANLISVYKALQERPDEFIKLCRTIEPAKKGEPLASARDGGKLLYSKRLKEVFDDLNSSPNADQALRYLFTNRTVWAGRVNYDLPSRMYFSNPNGWNIVKTNKLEKAAEILKDAKITCGSYENCLKEDGEDVFIYLDPPYLVNSNFSKQSQLYANNFTIEDHSKLAKHVKECKHKILLSYDDDKDGVIRGLYPESYGFHIYEAQWKYCGTSSDVKKDGKELIITNYKK